jgi:hypothetical protein
MVDCSWVVLDWVVVAKEATDRSSNYHSDNKHRNTPQ